MNRKKFEGGLWHHRVPDFKLVFCGPYGSEWSVLVYSNKQKRRSKRRMKNDPA